MQMSTETIPEIVPAEMTLEEKVDYLIASHDRILAAVSEIMAQVTPTLDALKDSPILKMMGVGK